MKLDIQKVAVTVFDQARDLVARDFGLMPTPTSPSDLVRSVINSLNLRPISKPHLAAHGSRRVFYAVIRSIGGAGRRSALFKRNEPSVRNLLFDYTPQWVRDSIRLRRFRTGDLKDLLQLSWQEVYAILHWVELLASNENYYETRIKPVALALLQQAQTVTPHEFTLLTIASLAQPPVRSEVLKLRGMGYLSASDFFRHLGWSSFRPGPATSRLFAHWRLDRKIDLDTQVNHLQQIVEAESAIDPKYRLLLREFLRDASLGAAITPTPATFAETDILLWMLATYVEKKNSESSENYFQA